MGPCDGAFWWQGGMPGGPSIAGFCGCERDEGARLFFCCWPLPWLETRPFLPMFPAA